MFREMAPILVALALAGCSGSRAPAQLSGLWSAGPAACEAGVGVRFEPDAIVAVYDNQAETLFARPRYAVERSAGGTRIRITYELPRIAGGARSVGAHGVVVLMRRADGWIEPASHQLVDPRTGAVRVRVRNDPVDALLTLHPCDGASTAWDTGLRGRVGA